MSHKVKFVTDSYQKLVKSCVVFLNVNSFLSHRHATYKPYKHIVIYTNTQNTHVFTCTRMCDSPHKPVNFYACMYVCSPVLSCSTAIVPLHPCRANFSFADFFSIFYRILFLCVCFFFVFCCCRKRGSNVN